MEGELAVHDDLERRAVAIVEDLIRLVLGSDRDASLRAQLALMGAGREAGHGTRHPGAVSGLIRA